jgi:16S rRNA (uracil1498-N3)-methyltransferase
MPRFYLNKTAAPGADTVITGSDAKHIRNVLRVKPGDALCLFDDAGFEYRAEVTGIAPGRVAVTIKERFRSKTESPIGIVLALAMLKDRKFDEIIRQVTELGVAAFIPFTAHRSVSRPDLERLSARTHCWKKIAAEALKQCGRSRAPDIHAVATFEEMLIHTRDCDKKIIFWKNRTASAETNRLDIREKSIRTVAVAIGPEGGFTDQEVEQAESAGFTTASLGPRILKADTAAIAACSLVQYRFGDMGQNYS